MAEEAGRVYFTIGADSSEADKEVGRSFGDMAKSAVKLAAAIYLAKKAFDVITGAVSKSVDAAKLADTTITDLAAAMKRAGEKDVRKATEEMLKFAGELQNVTGVSDEVISKAATLGASFGITGDNLKNAVKAAMDMSKVMGTDASAAMSLLARAASSGTNAMSRYGIEMAQTEDKGKRLESLLASINEKFGGAAQTAANTYAGRVEILSQNIGDLSEHMGRVVTQNKSWNAIVVVATEEVIKLQEEAKGTSDEFQEFGSSLVSTAGAIATGLATMIGYVIDWVNGIEFVVNSVLFGVVKLASTIIKAVMKLEQGLQSAIQMHADLAMKAADLPGPLGTTAKKIGGIFQGMADGIGDDIKKGLDVAREVDAVADVFSKTADESKAEWGKWGEKAVAAIDRVVTRVQDARKEVIVDPIAAAGAAGGVGAGAGGDGEGGADGERQKQLQEMLAGQYQSYADYYDRLADLQEKDALAFEAAQERKKEIALQMAQTMGESFGTAIHGMITGTMTAGEAFRKLAGDVLGIIQRTATNAIMAAAATAGAEGAKSQAGIPVIGPILAVGAASAMFALARGFLTKFHEGGIVGGRGREQLIVAEKGELVLPVEVTRTLLAASDRRQTGALTPAMAGAGANGMTIVNNFRSFMPAQTSDLARATREQERTREKMVRRGWIKGR